MLKRPEFSEEGKKKEHEREGTAKRSSRGGGARGNKRGKERRRAEEEEGGIASDEDGRLNRSGRTALALSSGLLLSQRRCRLPPVAIMIIYRDLISHDEMFCDIHKIREVADRLCLEVEGKMVSRTEGNIDDSLIGGNASTEDPEG
ncbi:hypothetical protein MJT46_004591 [Ovis ammon polii x Ovis aries]|nr:hypothetical protein MJT46_004591 [Ovis ammon polii x Ovis aries]